MGLLDLLKTHWKLALGVGGVAAVAVVAKGGGSARPMGSVAGKAIAGAAGLPGKLPFTADQYYDAVVRKWGSYKGWRGGAPAEGVAEFNSAIDKAKAQISADKSSKESDRDKFVSAVSYFMGKDVGAYMKKFIIAVQSLGSDGRYSEGAVADAEDLTNQWLSLGLPMWPAASPGYGFPASPRGIATFFASQLRKVKALPPSEVDAWKLIWQAAVKNAADPSVDLLQKFSIGALVAADSSGMPAPSSSDAKILWKGGSELAKAAAYGVIAAAAGKKNQRAVAVSTLQKAMAKLPLMRDDDGGVRVRDDYEDYPIFDGMMALEALRS